MKKAKLTAGDIVRVVQAQSKELGPTRYEITEVNSFRCMAREINENNPAVRYKPHLADVSMFKVDKSPWQIGDYVVIRRGHHFGVRMAGDTDFISTHENIYDALTALERYREADERRRA